MSLRGVLFVIAVAVLAETTAIAAERDASWWSRLWGRGNAPPAKKSADAGKAVKPATVIPSREKEIWLRRAEICQRLREIALSNNDDALLRKADQLDQRAWETYLQRIANVRSVAAGMQVEEVARPAARSTGRKTQVEDEP